MKPYQVTYFGSRFRNEFIEVLFSENRNLIIEEVKNTKIFSVHADTTSNITNKDRLEICVRYVSNCGKVK